MGVLARAKAYVLVKAQTPGALQPGLECFQYHADFRKSLILFIPLFPYL